MAFAPSSARHVCVTGAGGAIGGALAHAFASAAGGARITLVDKDASALERVAGGLGVRARTLVWDLSSPEAVPAAHDEAFLGDPVDVLVNCAGIMELRSFADTPWALAERLLSIDLLSPLRLMALAVPAMRSRGAGLVVNVASMAGLVPLRGSSYYGAAKAGFAMASEVARLELAPHGVHVLTVYPGPVSSELERRARAQVRQTWLARAMPTGNAEALARLVVRAAELRRPRVVYPLLYAAAAEILGVSRRFTERFSPQPIE